MSEVDRLNPDELLAKLQREEKASARGKLKIFFGMCPGVGKTYAMLQAARQKQKEGCEVVIGIVETHGRAETEALLDGLPIVPRMELEYRGTILPEMDLDAILLWHPGLAVVDELAHTNAPGSRHPKRHQDVLELLEAGIDVFTTLNVQHVESRCDTVQQITGVLVRETVPDSMLDLAHEIVLIDLTPEQLRARLADGKVYLGERATAAADNFFRESNLTALREMSLRLVAEHVDRDLRGIMQKERIMGPWKSGDRLMVAVRGSAFSEKLIRYTRRLAASMEASWMVVNIETSRALSPNEQTRLTAHLALARQLGAEVISTPGTDVGEALLRLAHQHNVTQIVLGKPLESRWARWFARTSPVDWLIRHSGEIDIHMIRSEQTLTTPSGPNLEERFASTRWGEFGLAILITAGVTGLCLTFFNFTGYWAIALFYLLTVVIAGTRLRRWPTMFLAASSALLWDLLFIPPRFTFYIGRFEDFLMFGAYFVIAIVIGNLTTRLREREQIERRREERATTLYRLTRALAASKNLDEALARVLALLKQTTGGEAGIWLRDAGGLTLHPASTMAFSEKDESVAAWTFQKRQAAGKSTDTLPDALALHLPLVAGDRAEGVLAVQLPRAATIEQRELLDAVAAQLVVFINKERALEQGREAQLASESQKLQKTLFDSVSHELKTPLAAISIGLQQPQLDRAELEQAARRLTRTVDHLLDATRLESGVLQLVREWANPAEILREAIAMAHLSREVKLTTAPRLPEIFTDVRLIQQALVSVLANADRYDASADAIEAAVGRDDAEIVFSIADRGAGLGPGEEAKVFDKFYRGPGKAAGGLGLGLSIARQLIEAHGGRIEATNRAGGGAHFSIRLPLGEKMKLPTESDLK